MAPPARPTTAFRTLAVASATLLACTTVRAPVSQIAPVVPVREGQAEPQLELWLEGNRTATPEEAAQASADARAVLDAALAGRVPDRPDDLLVVRAQGVTRTPGHRSDQRAAVAGAVIGAVVVVVATVVLVVAGGKGGHSAPKVPGAAKAPGGVAHGASHGLAAAPRASVPAPSFRPPAPPVPGIRPAALPIAPRVAPPVAVRPPAPGVGAYPRPPPHVSGSSSPAVGVYVGVEVPVGPVPPAAPAAPEGYLAAQPPPERPPGLDDPPGAGAEPPPAPPPPAAEAPPAPPPTVDALELAPLPPLPVASRGFWDGDVLELEAIVVDRATGQPRWRKTVERKVDPRDPAAVKAAVDVLLADGGWIPVY